MNGQSFLTFPLSRWYWYQSVLIVRWIATDEKHLLFDAESQRQDKKKILLSSQAFKTQLIHSYIKMLGLKASSCHCRVLDVSDVSEWQPVTGRGLNHPRWTLRPRHRRMGHPCKPTVEEDRESRVAAPCEAVSTSLAAISALKWPAPAERGEMWPRSDPVHRA